MRLPGWCEKCHQMGRYVRVSGAGMAMVAQHGVPTGICGRCEDAEDEKRRERQAGRGRGRRG